MPVPGGRLRRGDGYRVWVGGPVPPGADAITLGSLVIVRRRAAQRPDFTSLLDHERVHVEQWRRDGAVAFLVRYLGAYLRWRLRGYGHRAAYRRIPAEIEAVWRSRRTRAHRAAPKTPGSHVLR